MAGKKTRKKSAEEWSKQQMSAAASWLGEKAPGRTCPICKEQRLVLATVKAAVPAGEGILAGKSYPLVTAICENCAHQVFFNSVIMGIDETESEEDSDEGGDNGE